MSTLAKCPSCDAHYKLRVDRLPPSGAKVRCTGCRNPFIVFAEDSQPSPEAVDASSLPRVDFRTYGVDWLVHQPDGEKVAIANLATLAYMVDHKLTRRGAKLSFNGEPAIRIDTIDDLPTYFMEVFQRARNGQLGFSPPMMVDFDDEDDAPGGDFTPQRPRLAQRYATEEEQVDAEPGVEAGAAPVPAPLPPSRPMATPSLGGHRSPESLDALPQVDGGPERRPGDVIRHEPPVSVDRVVVSGAQSSLLQRQGPLFIALAAMFVFALALAFTLPYALRGMTQEEGSSGGDAAEQTAQGGEAGSPP